METPEYLLAVARDRAATLGLPYAGALTPAEAYRLWQLAPTARLVDLRTHAELDWVGRVPGALEIEWYAYPGAVFNPRFLDELRARVEPAALVLFLCRSGIRSDRAARLASEAGYATCFNVLEGFEGDRNAQGQRSTLNGWRHAGLPWIQG